MEIGALLDWNAQQRIRAPSIPFFFFSIFLLFLSMFFSVCCCRYFFFLRLCRHPLQRLFVDSSFAWRCRQTDPMLLRLVSSYFMIRHKNAALRGEGEQDGRAEKKMGKKKKRRRRPKRRKKREDEGAARGWEPVQPFFLMWLHKTTRDKRDI